MIHYDAAGNQIRLPLRSTLTYEAFAELVKALEPHHCSYPSGQRIDSRTKQPCRRNKVCDDGCEVHATRLASRKLRRGRNLPKAVKLKFANAATDQDLLSIRHDVALVDARLMELQGRLGTGESGEAWRELNEAWTDFIAAQQQMKQAKEMGDADSAAKWASESVNLMQHIGKLIKSGNQDEATWKEILSVQQLLTRYKTAETARLRESGQVLDAEQAMLLVQRMIDAVNDAKIPEKSRHELALTLARLVGIAGVSSAKPVEVKTVEMPRVVGLSVEDYLEG